MSTDPIANTDPKTLEQRLFKTYTIQHNPVIKGKLAIAAPEKRSVVIVLKPKRAVPKR